MAGVNLSQSMASQEEKSEKRLFSVSGFPMSIALLVLTLLGWGGLRFYIHTFDVKITQLETALTSDVDKLHGEHIDRVTDFDNRLTLLGADPAEFIDPGTLLSLLETLMVPQVVLTQYKYNEKEKVITLVGETDSFRYLAEQIISLKSDPLFSQTQVDAVERTENQKIRFTLKSRL